jgi:Protein of unknown function (DUF1186)
MTSYPFTPPVDQLLNLGDARDGREWPDYLGLGIGLEHVLDLIRMATDPALNDAPSDSPEVWAPAHAWRVLARLHAAEAAEPLAQLFRRIHENHDDFVGEDLPRAFGVLGPGAIQVLVAYLANSTNHPSARGAAAHSLKEIGVRHAEAREACIAALAEQLGRYADQDPAVNGFLIGHLLDLKGVEALDAMQRAFEAGAVDVAIAGDWEDVQIELGLKAKRDHPRRLTPMQLQLRETFAQLEAAKTRPQSLPTSSGEFEARAERGVHESDPSSLSKPARRRHRKRK